MALPSVSVVALANGNEADGSPVVFKLERTGDISAGLSVGYQFFGTAQAGSDYTGSTTGTISFAAGSDTATVSLPALADGSLIDPGETIIARINPSGSYNITPGKQFATATITAEGMVTSPKVSTRPGESGGEKRNYTSFAALKSDGTVVAWGDRGYGGTAPTGLNGVTQIFSNLFAFAALKSDGTVIAWGYSGYGSTAPTGLSGVAQIFSTYGAFVALKSDGIVVAWGYSGWGGTTPTGLSSVTQIFSTYSAFVALKSDGTVVAWGDNSSGGTAPAGLSGVTQIFSTSQAFAALKSDGTVVTWGNSGNGGTAPTGLSGVTQIFSATSAFAALKSDGSVVAWGNSGYGGTAPTGLSGVVGFANPFTDDRLVTTNSNVTLAVSPASVAEDGTTNLLYTFTRTGSITNSLTVNYSIGGTADSSDYTGATPGTGKTITFAAGASTATLTIDTAADTTIEADETVALSLDTGTGYAIGTASAVVGSISNDDKLMPTYTISPSTGEINEGSTLTTTVATTNVAYGTTIYWSIGGMGVTSADFSAGTLTGSGVVGTDGKFSFVHMASNDFTKEGDETLQIKLFTDSARTVQAGSTTSLMIKDTSTAPTYSLYSPSSSKEGSVINTTLYTYGVNPGTTLYWSLSGNGVDESDLVSGGLLGSGVVNLNMLTFSISLSRDQKTEGDELMQVRFFSDTARTIQAGNTSEIVIKDTSTTLIPCKAPSITFVKIADGCDNPLGVGIDGSVYILGNGFNTENNGNLDLTLTKVNAEGSKAWTRFVGSNSYDYPISLAIDGNGEISILGRARSSDQPGSVFDEVFVGRLGADGNILDTASLKYGNYSLLEAILVTNNRSVYFGGSTTSPFGGNATLGLNDAFIVKINPDLSPSWVQPIGGNGYDFISALTSDSDGNIYAVGNATGDLLGLQNSGSNDTFIVKYDKGGTVVWSSLLGGSGYDYGSSSIVSTDGFLFVAGDTSGDLDSQRNHGDLDLFLIKYSLAGERIWTKLIGTAEMEDCPLISAGPDGSILMAGTTQGNLDGQFNYGGRDSFISQYDRDGNLVWTKLIGTVADEAVTGFSYARGSLCLEVFNGDASYSGTYYAQLELEGVAQEAAYKLIQSSDNLNEGFTLTTTVATTNVLSGTTLYWSVGGTGIYASDFSSGALTGSGVLGTDGKFSFTHMASNDLTTEGDETLQIKLFTDSARTSQVGSTASVTLKDSSLTPAPTYVVTPSSRSNNEGSTLATTVATTNVASGTTLYWSVGGTGVTAADFSAGTLTGSGVVGTDGKFYFAHTFANDLASEGDETLQIKLFTDSARIFEIGSTTTVTVKDTSLQVNTLPAAVQTLTGSSKVGRVLTADKSAIVDPDGVPTSVSYGWEASTNGTTWTKLTSADATDNNSTYALTAAELGKTVRSVISYTDGYGTTETVRSAATTAIVANAKPTSITLSSSSIAENIGANKAVATLRSVDVDTDDAYTYALVSGTGSTDNNRFTIAGDKLTIISSPDFETKISYSIRLRTTDLGIGFVEKNLILKVTNVNEAPIAINLSDADFLENIAAGSVIANLTSRDPDGDTIFTYSLTPNSERATFADNQFFSIVNDQLKINASANFEQKDTYTISVRSTDAGKLFYDQVFTLNVQDVDEAPTNISITGTGIDEGVAVGSIVGSLVSTDQDESSTDFTYELVAGTKANNNDLFEIVGDQLKSKATFNFETKSSYVVNVRTTDEAGLTFDKSITIKVNNVNENPTDVTISATAFNENVAIGTTVSTLGVLDPDKTGTYTYSLVSGIGDKDNQAFLIAGNALKVNVATDYEVQKSYSARLRVTDQGGLFFEKSLALGVNNLVEKVSSGVSTTLATDKDTLELTGTKNVFGIGNQFDNTITGNTGKNKLTGGLGKDILTGGAGVDTFFYNDLKESLLSGFDVITDYAAGEKINVGISSFEGDDLIASTGKVSALNADNVGSLLTNITFLANNAAAFTVEGLTGTFLALNDGRDGFQADSDALIHLSKYTIGSTTPISII